MKELLRFLALLIVILLLIFSSCDQTSKSEDETEKTALEITQEGWQLYESGDYVQAIEKFTQAVVKDTIYLDAHVGLGWCYAMNNDLQNALTTFTNLLNTDDNLVDCYVGRAAVRKKMNDYLNAITDANIALIKNSQYVFSHDSTISFTDIKLLRAECYYNNKWYGNAQGEVDFLRSHLGLSAIDWVSLPIDVDGQTYDSYEKALLIAIENLIYLV